MIDFLKKSFAQKNLTIVVSEKVEFEKVEKEI